MRNKTICVLLVMVLVLAVTTTSTFARPQGRPPFDKKAKGNFPFTERAKPNQTQDSDMVMWSVEESISINTHSEIDFGKVAPGETKKKTSKLTVKSNIPWSINVKLKGMKNVSNPSRYLEVKLGDNGKITSNKANSVLSGDNTGTEGKKIDSTYTLKNTDELQGGKDYMVKVTYTVSAQ